MKKILLIILIIILILSVNVLAVDIDVGMPAIDRASTLGLYTLVNKGNPANITGTVTKVKIWNAISMTGCKVASFYEGAANVLSTRNYVTIGDVPSGYSEHTVSLDFNAGDYIGICYTTGNIEQDTAGFDGVWYTSSNDNIPCTNVTFTVLANRAISLYGEGITVGWDHKWNTQTISKWNTQEFTKWNDIE